MKTLTNFWNKLLIFGLIIGFVSCGEDPTPQIIEDEPEVEVEYNSEEAEEAYDFVMPSPLQIAAIFKRAGLRYNKEVMNSPEKVSNYTDRVSKALNFGVYAADLSYCVLNKQSQDAISHMNAVKTLADDLGMTDMFGSSTLFTSFENNLDNEDSLIYILATIQENLDEHLEDNEEQYMSVVFFTGGWAEGMHIGAQVAKDGEPSIASRLIEQMVILENVIEALEYYPHESEFLDGIIVDLKDIDNTYRNFESLKGLEMDNVSFADIKISEEELGTVIEKVSALRAKIVGE